MQTRNITVAVIALVVMLLAAGMANARPGFSPKEKPAAQGTVSGNISYQGRLTDASGNPLDGTYTMRFIVYDDAVVGSALWDSGNLSVTVSKGLFDVQLGVDQNDFNGKSLWLSIIIGGETLSPRQEILPAPYALSLRPGADIVGDSIAASDAVVAGYAPATGTAFYAEAYGGSGVYGYSDLSYGMYGSSFDSWGGYFVSQNGHGIRVETNSSNHYDHGAYITSQSGYAVYAQSANNMGVRGEAGDLSGVSNPLGPIGVVGLGQNRGVVGNSNSGTGVYASSQSNYGVWGQSSSYRGVTGRTDRSDNNYGFYTPDNMFAQNYTLLGATMLVMQNNGSTPLAPGDVVAFNGINLDETRTDAPIVQVRKVNQANSTAVAGVVFSRFNIDAVNPDLELPEAITDVEVTPAGDVAPGEYLLVVVQGPAQVNASALGGSIQPGDLLASHSSAGLAGKAQTMTMDGVETVAPGTVFGKALQALDGAQDKIYIFVTLQ